MNRKQRRMKQMPVSTFARNQIGYLMEQERQRNTAINAEYSWKMIMAAAGLVLHERGKSDEKVGNFLIAVQEYIDGWVGGGGDAETIIKELEEKTGIVLQMN